MKRKDAFRKLLAKALGYPGAFEDHPWDHTAAKCSNKKMFVIFGGEDESNLTCKLPQSGEAAITMFSFAEPTGYGMGEKGWVTATFGPKDDVPYEMLVEWIDESFRAIAPKRDLKLLDGAATETSPSRARRSERPSRASRRPAQ